jgi:hypothetical protein
MHCNSHLLEIFQVVVALCYMVLNTNIRSCARAKNRTFFRPLLETPERGDAHYTTCWATSVQHTFLHKMHAERQEIAHQ